MPALAHIPECQWGRLLCWRKACRRRIQGEVVTPLPVAGFVAGSMAVLAAASELSRNVSEGAAVC